jgi:hypothetical protein
LKPRKELCPARRQLSASNPAQENEARLPEELATRKDGFPGGFPVFGANAPAGALFWALTRFGDSRPRLGLQA